MNRDLTPSSQLTTHNKTQDTTSLYSLGIIKQDQTSNKYQTSIPEVLYACAYYIIIMRFEKPVIQKDGKLLIIFFNENHSSAFHAIWLWQNSGSNIMIPSGQRKQSPGNFNGKASVVTAEIHHCSFLQDELGYSSFLTRKGAIHPVNINNTNDDILNDGCSAARSNANANNRDCNANANIDISNHEDMSQFLLVLYWNQPLSTDFNSNEMNKRSIYNLQWLKDWAYDVPSLQSSRLKREVSVEHSFIHKYKHAIEEKDQFEIHRRATHKGLASVDYDDVVNQLSQDGLLVFLDVSKLTL